MTPSRTDSDADEDAAVAMVFTDTSYGVKIAETCSLSVSIAWFTELIADFLRISPVKNVNETQRKSVETSIIPIVPITSSELSERCFFILIFS